MGNEDPISLPWQLRTLLACGFLLLVQSFQILLWEEFIKKDVNITLPTTLWLEIRWIYAAAGTVLAIFPFPPLAVWLKYILPYF